MNKDFFILGIETSCDETSVAIVKNGREVLACEIATSVPLHQETKGVVPEVAARAQIEAMIPVIKRTLNTAQVDWKDISKIAVTQGPGLMGSLLVGVCTANILSLTKNIPLVGVPHIWGHMYANLLETDFEPQFPSLVLTISGGHNDLYLWKSHGEFKKLGHTLDDAAGEAFDKCGRMIDLPYPAGPFIGKLSEQGNAKAFAFPRSMVHSRDFNFSFSGLKTAFLYKLEELRTQNSELTDQLRFDLAASLQEAIVETLWKKVEKALEIYDVKEVHLSGGVSANKRLREFFTHELAKKEKTLRFPKNIKYCTDNAAMIACAAYFCNFPEGILAPSLQSK